VRFVRGYAVLWLWANAQIHFLVYFRYFVVKDRLMIYRIRVFVLPKYFLAILHNLRHALLSEVLMDHSCNPFFSQFLSFTLLPHVLFFFSLDNHTVTCQRIVRQRLDKHPAIRASNNRTNVYSSLLDNSQRANELAGLSSRDLWFLCDLRHATVELCFLRCPCRGITRVRLHPSLSF
jgi:hypothetical protein